MLDHSFQTNLVAEFRKTLTTNTITPNIYLKPLRYFKRIYNKYTFITPSLKTSCICIQKAYLRKQTPIRARFYA